MNTSIVLYTPKTAVRRLVADEVKEHRTAAIALAEMYVQLNSYKKKSWWSGFREQKPGKTLVVLQQPCMLEQDCLNRLFPKQEPEVVCP